MRKFLLVAALAATAVFSTVTPANAATHRPPSSCLRALTAADAETRLNIEFSQAVGQMFSDLETSANDAATTNDTNAFINSLSTTLDTLTTKVNDITTRLTPLAHTYHDSSAQCRAGR